MPTFVVTRVRGPRWDGTRTMREQDDWDAHAAFMDGLAGDGTVLLGGPAGEGEQRFLLIFEAEGPGAIERLLADDPWVASGQLALESIEPWQILLHAGDRV